MHGRIFCSDFSCGLRTDGPVQVFASNQAWRVLDAHSFFERKAATRFCEGLLSRIYRYILIKKRLSSIQISITEMHILFGNLKYPSSFFPPRYLVLLCWSWFSSKRGAIVFTLKSDTLNSLAAYVLMYFRLYARFKLLGCFEIETTISDFFQLIWVNALLKCLRFC